MLQGKTRRVTGVASGIGEETARVAQVQGARVLGVDLNRPRVRLDRFQNHGSAGSCQ